MKAKELVFENGPRPEYTKTISVGTEGRYLGCLVKHEDGWYCDYHLIKSVLLQPPRENVARKSTYQTICFGKKKEAIRQVTRLHYLMERTRRQATFHKDPLAPRNRHYDVRYMSLDIGKIEYRKSGDQKIRTIQERHNKSLQDYHNMRHGEEPGYYWILNKDLCKYLDIPFFDDENILTFNILKNFVRTRLLNNNVKLPATFNKTKSGFDAVDPCKLSAIVGYFLNQEAKFRLKWAQGEQGIYP